MASETHAENGAVLNLDDVLAAHSVTPHDLEVSLGLCFETVRLWRRGRRKIATQYALQIHEKFRIPLHLLRPDVWAPPARPPRRAARQLADSLA